MSAPRQCICGYFDSSLVSILDLALIVRSLRDTLAFEGVLIGSQLLFQDNTSFVVDFGEVHALHECRDLIQEAVLVSRKRAIITTLFPKQMWEPIITQQMLTMPLGAISCIRFRKALNLPSSVWLKPMLTGDQIQTARQRCVLAKQTVAEQNARSLQAHLRIEGLPHIQHESICLELMQKIAEISDVVLSRAATHTPQSGEWAPCYRSDGSFSQQIVIQLHSAAALGNIIMHVNGSGVKVAGKNLVVEVRSIHPNFSAAGLTALNFVLDAATSPTQGTPCL